MLPLLASLSVGFGFSVPSGAKECFEEHAAEGEHVLGTWSVKHEEATPPTLSGWKVTVTSGAAQAVYSSEDEQHGSFDFYATKGDVYVACFANGHEGTAGGGASAVHVNAKITVGDPPDLIQLAKTEHLSPIEERIKNLHESMNAVRDLQDQMREQDEAQSKMTRSTRSWLLYFTLLEAFVLVAMTTWQNLYLKSFFEVKRVV